MKNYSELLSEYIKYIVDIERGKEKPIYDQELTFLDKYTSKKINSLLCKPENLQNDYLKLLKEDETSQRYFLQKLYFSKPSNSIELTSFLYHLFCLTQLKEIKFYIFRTLPRIQNELSFWLTLRYTHITPPNYSEKEKQSSSVYNYRFDFNEFKSPHFPNLATKLIEARLELLKYISKRGTALTERYMDDCIKYLVFCYNQGTVQKNKFLRLLYDIVHNNANPSLTALNIACTGEPKIIFETVEYLLRILRHLINLQPDLLSGDYPVVERSSIIINHKIIRPNLDIKKVEDQQRFYIYNDIVRAVKESVRTIGIITDYYEKIDNLLIKIETCNLFTPKEKSRLEKVISEAKRKQKRLKDRKFKKGYKNPNTIWERDFSIPFDLVRTITFFRTLDSPLWSKGEMITADLENEVREELGLPQIGEQYKNETLLYYLISQLLVDKNVKTYHHYRPKFLMGQELDIYFDFDGIKVGIEYQGLQHFQPVEYFGGENAFKKNKERDKRKNILCQQNEVNLIYFDYNENITQDLIIKKLDEINVKI